MLTSVLYPGNEPTGNFAIWEICSVSVGYNAISKLRIIGSPGYVAIDDFKTCRIISPASLIPDIEAVAAPPDDIADILEEMNEGIANLEAADGADTLTAQYELQRDAMKNFRRAIKDLDQLVNFGVDTGGIHLVLHPSPLRLPGQYRR
ncbi:hypothetical protein ACFLX3_03750 [Chloroflexota bacterium]